MYTDATSQASYKEAGFMLHSCCVAITLKKEYSKKCSSKSGSLRHFWNKTCGSSPRVTQKNGKQK